MKKILFILFTIGFILPLTAQTVDPFYGQQLANSNFELWENDGGTLNEPTNWNSFATVTGSLASTAKSTAQLARSTDKRPGSTGTYSAQIKERKILFIINANGNLTCGRINAGNMSAADKDNHNFTDRNDPKANQKITVRPDSITVWVKYNGGSGKEARVAALLHDDFNVKDPYGIQSDGSQGHIVTSAELNYSSNGNVWQRLSIPFTVKSGFNGTDPQYMLVSISTNKTPGGGSGSDVVFADDLLLVYTPELVATAMSTSSIANTSAATPITVTYTLSGTMEPTNGNTTPNKVKLQLSDAQGNFPNNVTDNIISDEITYKGAGAVDTPAPQTISGTIPAGTPAGSYKVRVVTTNYEIKTTENNVNVKDLKIGSDLSLSVNNAAYGSVEGSAGRYLEGAQVSLNALPATGYKFVNWTKDGGSAVSTSAAYTHTMGNADATLTANFEIIRTTLTLGVNNAIMGSVQGTAGTYDYGTTVPLKAIAVTGYEFVNWTNNTGQSVSTNAEYTYTAGNENTTLTANFKPSKFEVTVAPNNSSWGTVSGGGSFDYKTTQTLTATAKTGYEFVNWTKGGVEVSTSTTFTYTIPAENTALTANFKPSKFTVTVASNNTEWGTVSGGGSFDYNSTQTLTATPKTGYEFVNWTKGDVEVSTSATFAYTLPAENTLLTANFKISRFTFAVTPNNTAFGSVNSATVDGTYDYNSQIEVVATPATGYEFVNWTKGGQEVSTSPTYTYTLGAGNTTLTANFKISRFTFAVISGNAAFGSVNSVTANGTYDYNSQIEIVATPVIGYEFVNWTKGGQEVSTSATYTYTLGAENTTLTANFKIIRLTLTLNANDDTFGTVSGDGTYDYGSLVYISASPASEEYRFVEWRDEESNPVTLSSGRFELKRNATLTAYFVEVGRSLVTLQANYPGGATLNGTGSYLIGKKATISVTPAAGYKFVKWVDEVTAEYTNNPYTFTVNENSRTFTAVLEKKDYSVKGIPSDNVKGTVSGSGTYQFGSTVILTAAANPGYEFVNWTKNGEQISANETLTYTVPAEASVVTANFKTSAFTVAIAANNALFGTVSAGGSFNYQASVVLTATPNAGYEFVNWTIDGNPFSYNATATYIVKVGNVAVTANFKPKKVIVDVKPNNANYGSVSGGGALDYNSGSELVATPKAGYEFENWTIGETVVSTDARFTYTVPLETVAVRANFKPARYTVTLERNEDGWGTVSGGGTFDYKTAVTLTAVPEANYEFANWTIGEEIVSTKKTYTYTVEASGVTITANFKAKQYAVNLKANNSTWGTVSGGGLLDYNAEQELTAAPNAGYEFVDWTIGETVVSTDARFTYTVPAETVTLRANFKPARYTVTLESNSDEWGAVSGGGTFGYKTPITLTAVPQSDYEFVNWTKENGDTVSVSKTCTYTVEASDVTITANFRVKQYTITVKGNNDDWGTVSGGGVYDKGARQTLVAEPAPGYSFSKWTLNGAFISEDPELTVNVTGKASYVAYFYKNIGIDEAELENILVFGAAGTVELRNLPDGTTVQLITTGGVYREIGVQITGDASLSVEEEGIYIVRLFGPWGEKAVTVSVKR